MGSAGSSSGATRVFHGTQWRTINVLRRGMRRARPASRCVKALSDMGSSLSFVALPPRTSLVRILSDNTLSVLHACRLCLLLPRICSTSSSGRRLRMPASDEIGSSARATTAAAWRRARGGILIVRRGGRRKRERSEIHTSFLLSLRMGPVAVVTGCTQGGEGGGPPHAGHLSQPHRPHAGIGHAIAVHLACAGCIVYATARRLEAMGQLPKRMHAMVLDVSSEASIHQAITQIIGREGRIDILVNNAGIGEQRPSSGCITLSRLTLISSAGCVGPLAEIGLTAARKARATLLSQCLEMTLCDSLTDF